MAMQKLSIQQRFRLLDERQQNFRRHPELSFEDAADGLRQFSLPRLVEFHKAINAPAEEPYFFRVAVVARRQKSQELAAGSGSAAASSDRPQVGVQGTCIENEKPR